MVALSPLSKTVSVTVSDADCAVLSCSPTGCTSGRRDVHIHVKLCNAEFLCDGSKPDIDQNELSAFTEILLRDTCGAGRVDGSVFVLLQ